MLAVVARQWGFGPDKQRTYEVTSKAATTNGTTFNPLTMTWFASPGHFEVDEEKDANGNWKLNECRHTIGSPEGNIGLVVTNCSNHSQNSDFTDRSTCGGAIRTRFLKQK